jgi:glycosyltransferase involved in cell wall biosynthesis
MRALATRLGLGARVRFVGFADSATKRRLYRESDVFALPSFQENFGIAVAEAMAHGLPVVISNQVALAPEVLAAGAGSVVDPENSSQFAASLASFEDNAARARVSEAARQLVRTRFSIRTMAEALQEMYLDVLRERSAGAYGAGVRPTRLA